MFVVLPGIQSVIHVRIKGGGQGFRTPTPLKNHKFIGFLINTGPVSLKITKLPSQHSTVGHYRPASETPFQWRFAGRSIITRIWLSLEPRSPKKYILSEFYQSIIRVI